MITWESPDNNSVLIELWIHMDVPCISDPMRIVMVKDISHEEWYIVFEGYSYINTIESLARSAMLNPSSSIPF